MNEPVERILSVTEPVAGLADYLAIGGGEALERARGRSPESVIEELRKAGLRGRGGAGFATAKKWASTREHPDRSPKYLVCNAAEGEPGTFKDRFILRRNPYQVIEGIAIAVQTLGIARAFIAIKAGFRKEINSLLRALDEMRAAGMLEDVSIQLVFGSDDYLFGEEKATTEVVEGGRPPLPRILPPYQVGLFAKRGARNPALVQNVETLAHVPNILRRGAEAFRENGTEDSPGTAVFTVCGDVRHPGVFELPLGLPLRVLIDVYCGGPASGGRVKAVLPGASAALLTEDQLDTPLEFGAMRAAGSGLGSAGLVVYDDTACMVAATLAFSRFLSVESCGQCPACKHGSAEITDCLWGIERGDGEQQHIDTALAKCAKVTGGQRCFLPTGEAALVRSAIGAFGAEFHAHLGRGCPARRAHPVPKIVDFDDVQGVFHYDENYHLKRPDWTYAAGDDLAEATA